MRIGVDVDDTLADFSGAYLKALTRIKEPNRQIEGRFPNWHWPKELGYTREDEAKAWVDINASPTFWAGLRPLLEAQAALTTLFNLYQNGHSIYFITTRMTGNMIHVQTMAWLMAYGFATPQVVLTKEKGLTAIALELDLFVDDKPANCFAVKSNRPACQTFLVRRFDEVPEDLQGCVLIPTLREFFMAIDKELATNAVIV